MAAVWTKQHVEVSKQAVRQEIETACKQLARKERLAFILDRAFAQTAHDDPESHLRAYLYILAALVHHRRDGGLRDHQVKRLTDSAFGILSVHDIKNSSRRMAYLYGDLHLVLSQIYRRTGEPWRAAWEQQLSARMSFDDDVRDRAFNALGLAVRALRLGYGPAALDQFVIAEAESRNPQDRISARLGRIKAMRLMRRIAQARALTQETKGWQELAAAAQGELAWEEMCQDLQEGEDIRVLTSAVRPGKTHYKGFYILEAHLWVKSNQSAGCMKHLPPIKTLARRGNLTVVDCGMLYQTASVLDDSYSTDFPFTYRIRRLGDCLNRRHELVGIDLELLALAAAIRWLVRSHSFHLAALLHWEYQAISLRLTDGQHRDALNWLGALTFEPGNGAELSVAS